MALTLALLLTFLSLALALEPAPAKNHVELMVKAIQDLRQYPEVNALLSRHELDFARIYAEDEVKSRQTVKNDFRCDSMRPSREPPTTVHMLRPADVQVMGAMGDSLTAGNGAKAWTVLGVLDEDRGRVFSIGGDRSYPSQTTIPKFIESYNPLATGYSWGTGGRGRNRAGMNVGEPGDEARHMPGQARMLIDRMREHEDIDYENDWKIVTLFIGGNDLCTYCTDPTFYSPERYGAFIEEALDMLHAEMPRTIVNVLPIFDMQHIADLGRGLSCAFVHWLACPCKPSNEADMREISEYSHAYMAAVENLVASGKYDQPGRTDFTVVVQPMFKQTTPPLKPNGKYDYSYWAPDCFHFSSKGHNAAGFNLWNSMLQPVGAKIEEWDPEMTDVLCTSEQQPFFATNLNSANGDWLPWDQIPQ